MGNLQAEAYATGGFRDDIALTAHLQSNHYPPVSERFVPACISAIAMARAGNWEMDVELPDGGFSTAQTVVEGLHLQAWVDREEDIDG